MTSPKALGKMKLPKKLGKEPLLEAVFEMRFKARIPVSSVLPGLIFAQPGGERKIERLPVSEIPEQYRVNDPNLRYAPLIKIHWDNFLILIGDLSLILACKPPYPGWRAGFRPAIMRLAELVGTAEMIDAVERFSLKYTNIITDVGDAPSVVKFALKVGSHDIESSLFQIRAEIVNANLITIVQLAAEGTASLPDGSSRRGVALDIDTIAMYPEGVAFKIFLANLSDGLEAIHSELKATFFDCLKPAALKKLEPAYD
jgi:uncharacterized protein (TIGR04255 family)